jgi:hypothetical protein
MSYLIGTAVCGWVIVTLYLRLANEWSRKDRNLSLIAGQMVFLLALVGLGITGVLLWWGTRTL